MHSGRDDEGCEAAETTHSTKSSGRENSTSRGGLRGDHQPGAGGDHGLGDGGIGWAIGHDGQARVEAGGESEGFPAEFAVIEGEDGALGRGDHFTLGGDHERVVIPDAGLGDAGAAEDSEVGVHLAERPSRRGDCGCCPR
jgi:hypothetical protein